jgi:Na+-driven multidrug efflux pump
MAMETLVVQGSYFALLALVNSYGAATAAAYSGAAQLWIYVQIPSNALATSMSTMAAMNIGASQWDRVEKIALRGCLMGLAISAFATAVIYALGDAPLRLFIPEGGEVLEKARHINSHALWGWVALSASMGLFGVIRANGAMLAPMLIFAVTMWGIRVPFAVLLRPWLGEDAIWWSFPFGSIFSAAIAWAYYCWGGWRRQALMLAPHATPVEELL